MQKVCLLLLISFVLSQIDHKIDLPPLFNIQLTNSFNVSVKKGDLVKQTFDRIPQEIGGRVWSTKQKLTQKDIYNLSKYQIYPQCEFISSQIHMNQINSIEIPDTMTIQKSLISPYDNRIYALISKNPQRNGKEQKYLNVYSVGRQTIKLQKQKVNLQFQNLLQKDIFMVNIFSKIIITDGIVFKILQSQTHQLINLNVSVAPQFNLTIDNDFVAKNQFIKLLAFNQQKSTNKANILECWDALIRVWQINYESHPTIKLIKTISPPSNDLFVDAIMHGQQIWVLARQKLLIYKGKSEPITIKLQSQQCWGLKEYNRALNTLHMICMEGGQNYIAQFYISQSYSDVGSILKLNRYYTDIDDAEDLFFIGSQGNNKLFIIGEQQLILYHYAANRHILLEIDGDLPSQRYKGFGIKNVQQLPIYSSFKNIYLVGVANNFITFFLIEQQPASIYCQVKNITYLQTINLLVQINTTQCNSKVSFLCRNLVPLTLNAVIIEVQNSKKQVVSVIIFLMFGAIGLTLLGCAFKCKTIKNKTIGELQKKFKALKQRRIKPI